MTRLFVFVALFSMLGIGQGVYRVRALRLEAFPAVIIAGSGDPLFVDRRVVCIQSSKMFASLLGYFEQLPALPVHAPEVGVHFAEFRAGRIKIVQFHRTQFRSARARRQGPAVLATVQGSAKNINIQAETLL